MRRKTDKMADGSERESGRHRVALSRLVLTMTCGALVWGLACPLTSLGASPVERKPVPGDFPRGAIAPEQSLRLLKKAPADTYVLLDVRTPEAYAEGHLPGSVNIPLEELESRLPEFAADKPLFLTCQTGRRAAEAFALIRDKRPDLIVAFIQACVRYGDDNGPDYRLDPPGE